MVSDIDRLAHESAVKHAAFAVDWLLAPGSPIAQELRDAGKLGGYFCLATHTGLPLLVTSCGSPDEGKVERYLTFCQEKARRLGSHLDHFLSLESRDEGKDHWGGAVRGVRFIASFSGFPELLDEVVSAAVLRKMGELDLSTVLRRLKGNPYLEKIPRWYFRILCGM